MNLFGHYVETTHIAIIAIVMAIPLIILTVTFLHGLVTVLWNEIRGREG